MSGHKPFSQIKHKNDSPEKRARIKRMAERLAKLMDLDKDGASEEAPSETDKTPRG